MSDPNQTPPPSREIWHTMRLGETWSPPTSVQVINITPVAYLPESGRIKFAATVIDNPSTIG